VWGGGGGAAGGGREGTERPPPPPPGGPPAAAAGASSAPSSASAAAPTAPEAVQLYSSKKLRCICCLANLKDQAKAHPCPGCSDVFCWRCERKDFIECSNGPKCVHPLSRCERCRCGDTLEDLCGWKGLKKAGEAPPFNLKRLDTNKLRDRIGDFSLDVLPVRFCETPTCSNCPDNCDNWECYRCAVSSGSEKTNLEICCRCFKAQCRECLTSLRKLNGALLPMEESVKKGGPLSSAEIDSYAAALRSTVPDIMLPCDGDGCPVMICFECIDHVHLRGMVRAVEEELRVPSNYEKRTIPARCGTCYYKAKPCTNPSCPNDAGVPTKRCRACHIDRYCSVECQAAAYPGHVGRCKKIQEKRAEKFGGGQEKVGESKG